MSENNLAWSRPEKTALDLGDDAPDRHRFTNKTVLLTGESAVLTTQNGRRCFLDCLLLLIRICRNVTVSLPENCQTLEAEARLLGARMAFQNGLRFRRSGIEHAAFDAILSVGTRTRPKLPWTVVNSNGWVARVSSGSAAISGACEQFNAVGALAAACFGVCEVFKRLIFLKKSRGRLLNGLSFCVLTHECVSGPGPAIPEAVCVDLLVVGLGAIGNGIVHLLSTLPLVGRVRLIDPQSFGVENRGTCLLIGPTDIGRKKAEFAEDLLLTKRLEAKGYEMRIEEFVSDIANTGYPTQIVCALDNIEARHAAQNLWPAFLADGAIGDFPCQVTSWSWDSPSACLRCVFQEPRISATMIASRATGLDASRTSQGDTTVTDADVAAAPPEKAAWLRSRKGLRVCSVVEEGIAAQLSEQKQKSSFAPSVPFVACLSSCMVVAQLVAQAACWDSNLETRFQFDLLQGPEQGEMYPENCRDDCFRIERKQLLEEHRSTRTMLAH